MLTQWALCVYHIQLWKPQKQVVLADQFRIAGVVHVRYDAKWIKYSTEGRISSKGQLYWWSSALYIRRAQCFVLWTFKESMPAYIYIFDSTAAAAASRYRLWRSYVFSSVVRDSSFAPNFFKGGQQGDGASCFPISSKIFAFPFFVNTLAYFFVSFIFEFSLSHTHIYIYI